MRRRPARPRQVLLGLACLLAAMAMRVTGHALFLQFVLSLA
ncbi:MAG: hypothetical protein ACYTGG_03220 [Planctomycetota bacterium]|jgi:hypothetical protein